MIESPPKIRKEDFDKALRLSCDPKIADVVNEINRQYQYWTEIKYKHLPDKVLAQDVWACVKLSRMFAKTLEIGNYRFKLYVTDHLPLKAAHETAYAADIFTVRGVGRFKLAAIGGKSRKDRLFISFYQY